MSITQILINVFFILSVIFVACFPKKKRIWWIFFICNVCVQIYFRTDSFFKSKKFQELNKQVDNLSAIAPKLDLHGRIVQGTGVSFSSEFNEGIERARTLYNQEKFDEAYEIAKSLARKKPDFGLAYFIMGTIEVNKGNDDSSAEANLLKAINLGIPKYEEALTYYNLAVIKQKQSKIDDALSLLEKGVKSDSTVKEIKEYLDKLRLIQSQK